MCYENLQKRQNEVLLLGGRYRSPTYRPIDLQVPLLCWDFIHYSFFIFTEIWVVFSKNTEGFLLSANTEDILFLSVSTEDFSLSIDTEDFLSMPVWRIFLVGLIADPHA